MDFLTYVPYNTTSSTTLEKYIEGLKEISSISRYCGDLRTCLEIESPSFGQYSEWYIGYRTVLQKPQIEEEYRIKWEDDPKIAFTWLLEEMRRYHK